MPVKQWALKLNNRVVGHNSHHVWSKECMTLLCVKNVIDVVGLCLSLIFYHRKLITITFFLGAVIFNCRQVLLFFPVRSFVRSFIHSFIHSLSKLCMVMKIKAIMHQDSKHEHFYEVLSLPLLCLFPQFHCCPSFLAYRNLFLFFLLH